MAVSGLSARLQILLTALLFSTGGAAIKAASLTSWQIASLRSGIAALVLFVAGRRLRQASLPILLVGAAYAATLVSFVTANKLTTAAHSVFLQAAAPLYIAVLGPWLLRERVSRQDLPVMGAVLAGLLLLFVGTSESSPTAPNPWLGNLVGGASGVGWCFTIMGLRWVEKRGGHGNGEPAGSAALWGNVIACVACLPAALPLSEFTGRDLAIVSYLGVFQVGLAYVLLTRAIGRVPAVEASILLLAEPASSPLWAWLVHHESPGPWPLVGGALIVGSTAWKAVRDPPP